LIGGLASGSILFGGCGVSATDFENGVRDAGTQVVGLILANLLIVPIQGLLAAFGLGPA
jgi:hypothetical protein